MVYVLIFIFGAIIGSFLNVVIDRYNTGESIIYSGSRCFSCGKKLSWTELFPVLSFLIQKGRCRQCKSKISWQYPVVEALTGLIFLAVFWKLNPLLLVTRYSLLVTAFYWLVFSLLIIISVYDFRHQIIPNAFVYPFIALSFFYPIITRSSFLVTGYDYITGLAFFSFFGFLWLVSKGKWMGLADAKLALGVGWLLGPVSGLIAVLSAFWIGAIFSIFLLLFSRKNFTLKSRIPFGPFLAFGTLIAFLFSSNVLQIYFNIFGRII